MSEQVIQYGKHEVTANNGKIIESLVLRGDIAGMNATEKVQYYNWLCQSLGLNPATQPFQIIKFQGREALYAKKDATEQLRRIYGVAVMDMQTNQMDGIVVVKVTVRDASGRTDIATGAVSIKGLSGEALCNAYMKAETKAKRRATLSICGLGMLDESELDTMPQHQTMELPKVEVKQSKPIKIHNDNVVTSPFNYSQPITTAVIVDELAGSPVNEEVQAEVAIAEDQKPKPRSPKLATEKQIKMLLALGTKFYNGTWDAKRKELCLSVSHNRTEHVKELYIEEVSRLIDGLKQKLEQREAQLVDVAPVNTLFEAAHHIREIEKMNAKEAEAWWQKNEATIKQEYPDDYAAFKTKVYLKVGDK